MEHVINLIIFWGLSNYSIKKRNIVDKDFINKVTKQT